MTGPLNSPDLQTVQACLDNGNLEQAQRLLGQIYEEPHKQLGVSFLATRLLFLRGRLDSTSVAERMLDLLGAEPNFPEAEDLLRKTENFNPQRGRITGSPSYSPTPIVPSSFPPETGLTGANAAHAETLNDYESSGLLEFPEANKWSNSPERAPTSKPPEPGRPHTSSYPEPGRASHSTPPAGISLPPLPTKPLPSVNSTGKIGSSAIAPRRVEVDTTETLTSLNRISQIPGRWGQESVSSPDGRYASRIPPPPEALEPTRSRSRLPSLPPRPAVPPRPSVGARAPTSPPEARVPLVPVAPHSQRRLSSPPPSGGATIWHELELRVWRGEHLAALAELEALGKLALRELSGPANLTTLSSAAARLLSSTPVTHCFAPFDLSLQSLGRLELALRAMLPTDNPGPACSSLILLYGAYLGETLRFTQRARWIGRPQQLLEMTVETDSGSWSPFRAIRETFVGGSPLPLLDEQVARPGTQAWSESRLAPVPRALWRELPHVDHLPRLALDMCQSPYSLACRARRLSVLDRSVQSLQSLGDVFGLLSASAAPLHGSEAWLIRLCVLTGAYLGEVLRTRLGGHWHWDDSARGLEGYVLKLPAGSTRPMAILLRHGICQQPEQVVEYAFSELARSGERRSG